MSQNIRDLAQDVIVSPLGDVIASVGKGVAEAQQALDDASLAKTLEIYTSSGDDGLAMLKEIGYRPTFYALPDTTGEIRVSLSLQGSENPGQNSNRSSAVSAALGRVGRNIGQNKPKLYATPVDAGFANRYGYQANISAKLTFRIVPVPAPNRADEIRVMPELAEKTAVEAITELEDLGLRVEFLSEAGEALDTPTDGAVVQKQEPEAGKFILAGEAAMLTISEPG